MQREKFWDSSENVSVPGLCRVYKIWDMVKEERKSNLDQFRKGKENLKYNF